MIGQQVELLETHGRIDDALKLQDVQRGSRDEEDESQHRQELDVSPELVVVRQLSAVDHAQHEHEDDSGQDVGDDQVGDREVEAGVVDRGAVRILEWICGRKDESHD